MKKFLPYLGVSLVAALTLLSGMVHGRLSHRWGPSRNLLAAAEKLQGVPTRIGDWQLESSQALDETVRESLECAGYLQQTYRNETTRQRVAVAVLLGPSGPISVHTPEICYSSTDYAIEEPRQRVAFDNGQALGDQLWATTFRSPDLQAAVLRVYYGWSDGGAWMADDNPRFAFAGRPHLYKIQVAGQVPAGELAESLDPCRQFLTSFLPVLKDHLVHVQRSDLR